MSARARERPRRAGANDRPPVARRRCGEPRDARISRRARRRVASGVVGRGRADGRRARARPARVGRAQGRRVRDPRADDARVGAVRLRARARRRDRRSRSTRTARPRTRSSSSRTPRPSASLCEDEEQRAKIEPLGLAHVWTFADLDELRERGRAHARRASRSAYARRPQASSEDDLFTYIYTSGTTGPPKALHDPPPQLLRDGRRRRPARATSRPPTTSCCSTCRSRTTSGG